MSTFADQIHEVLRTVDSTASDPVIAVAQTFATTPDDLWEACTDPARLARWFEPIEGDLSLGGRYELGFSGTEGTIERCERPMLLAITWEYGDDASRVVVTIARAEGGARLTIAHASPRDDHWEAYGPAAGGMGWDESLLALALHLADDERSTPDAMEALFESDEGRAFAEASAAAWQRAFIDAGADPAEAEAAAARAIAAVFDED